jgi:polyisoprenoid-binding protein YceI
MFCLCFGSVSMAQVKLTTRTGSISFYSVAPMENIEAHSHSAASVINKETGEFEIGVVVKSFAFEKALMQEHFNENYLETHKFPRSTFRGRINDLEKVDFNRHGQYGVTVSGQLVIHGETRTVTTPAIISVKPEGVAASAMFSVLLSDYKIRIPALVRDKISNDVKIVVNLTYDFSPGQ